MAEDIKEKSITVRVLITVGNRIVLVREMDPKRFKERLWKLPGGGAEPEDGGDVLKTAQRETFEETGINLPDREFELVTQMMHPSNPNHTIYLVFAKAPGDSRVRVYNQDGEEVRVALKEEFIKMCTEGALPERHLQLLKSAPIPFLDALLNEN